MSDLDRFQRYGHVAIALHWTIALCVIGTIILALTIVRIDMGETKATLTTLHKSIGISIFVLTVVRLCWRITHTAPPLPDTISRGQRYVAKATHFILYGLTFAMPVTGYISVAARARETTLFWLVDVPRWVPLDRTLSRTAEMLHTNGQYVLYVLLAGHIGAALYHRFLLKDVVFQRMWPRAYTSKGSVSH